MARSETPDFLVWLKENVLAALFEDDYLLEQLVLKGGTAIELLLTQGLGRASLDIDFSVSADLAGTVDALQMRVSRVLEGHFAMLGFTVFDVKLEPKPDPRSKRRWPEFWGGYRGELKILESERFEALGTPENRRRNAREVAPGSQRKFKFEISKHEHIGDEAQPLELGDTGTVVYVYSVPLLVAEKLRAICQQMPEYPHGRAKPRARDFYDAARLADHFGDDAALAVRLAALLPPVFAAKEVDLVLLDRVAAPEVLAFHADDFGTRLRATVDAGVILLSLEAYAARLTELLERVR